jgi:hypothetical protein
MSEMKREEARAIVSKVLGEGQSQDIARTLLALPSVRNIKAEGGSRTVSPEEVFPHDPIGTMRFLMRAGNNVAQEMGPGFHITVYKKPGQSWAIYVQFSPRLFGVGREQ